MIRVVVLPEATGELANALAARSRPERRYRAARFRLLGDQARCLAAGLLLDRALAEDFAVPPGQALAAGPQGKPHIAGFPQAHFNLSHSGDLVTCATSAWPVGVDVELNAPQAATIGTSHFRPGEADFVERGAPDERALRFIIVWTRKEAYLKYRGCGLSEPLTSFSVVGRGADLRAHEGQSAPPWLGSVRQVTDRHVLSWCGHEQDPPLRSVPLDVLTEGAVDFSLPPEPQWIPTYAGG